MKKSSDAFNHLFKKKIYLLLFLVVLIIPVQTFSNSNLITFPDKIDTLQERKNIQIVLNRVIVPSMNLVVDGVIGRGTIRAIQTFQALKGLVADGKVGPITRKALEDAQNNNISAISGCAPGALFNTLNGQPCSLNSTNLPPGCFPGALFSTLNGQSCSLAPTSNLPLGCNSTSGFSTVTGQSCGVVTLPVSGGGSSGGGGGSSGGGGNNIITPKYLVKDNIGNAEIIISPTAPNMVKLAGNYFQKYIKDMTGVELPIVESPGEEKKYHVYIGQSTYTDNLNINVNGTENGGYKIVSDDNYLVLLGDDKLLSVYGPHSGPPENKSSATLYAEWDALTGEKWRNDYIDFFHRSYNNTYNIWESDGRGTMNAVHEFLYDQGIRWYAPDEFGTIIPTKSDIIFKKTNQTINPDMAMRNLWFYFKEFTHLVPYHYPNGRAEREIAWQMSLRGNNYRNILGRPYAHGIANVIGREETKIAHPEYYAIWGGNRMNVGTEQDLKPDLCSPGLFAYNVKYVKAMFDIYDEPTVSVMPTDGYTQVSESSPECIARATPERGYEGRISDYVWEYVNNVAWEIYNDPNYAGKKIINSAYGAYALPPLNLSKPVAPNLIVMIGSRRDNHWDPIIKEANKNLFNQWYSFIPSHQIYSYTVYINNRPDIPSQSVPSYYPHLISDDLKFLKTRTQGEGTEISTDWASLNLNYDPLAVNSLNVYLTARLYWDVNQDVDDLLEEYYRLYYGPAKTQMKAFIEYSEANYKDALKDGNVLRTMRQMLNNAKITAGNTIYGQRIDKIIALINSNFIGEEVIINSCQDLNSPTTIYKLGNDVSSSGTCFNVMTSGITLDCQGHKITYGNNDDVNQNGVFASYFVTHHDLTIKNCVFEEKNSVNKAKQAIYLSRINKVNILNNTINITGAGMSLVGINDLNITGNMITAPKGGIHTQSINNAIFEGNIMTSTTGKATYLYDTHDSEFTNNMTSSVDENGMTITLSTNNLFENNTFQSTNKSGLFEYQSSGNTFINNIIIPAVLGVSTFNFTQNLKQGLSGNEVRELQNYLINKGYLNSLATGYFGSKTLEAVKRYQKDNNLISDGLVGPKTRELLNR